MSTTNVVVSQQAFAATMPKYWKGASNRTIQKNLLWNMLQRAGGIKWKTSGKQYHPTVTNDLPPVMPWDGQGGNQFQPTKMNDILTFTPRGAKSTDFVSDMDEIINGDTPESIVNIMTQKTPQMEEALDRYMAAAMFVDGSLPQNALLFEGLGTIHKYTSPGVNDKVAIPNGTYGNFSTALGQTGGAWNNQGSSADWANANIGTSWPDGTGSPKYDWNSPIGVNIASNRWTGGPQFNGNAESVLSAVLMWTGSGGGGRANDDGTGFVTGLGARLYQDFKDCLRPKQREMLPHPDAVRYGFYNNINFEGAIVYMDQNIAPGDGYGFEMSNIEFKTPFSSDNGLYKFKIEHNLNNGGTLYWAGVVGNFVMNAKRMVKLSYSL